ncbi:MULTISPECIES: 50S ribosomal protein L24 [Euryhalocaulis]|uniref:50S ribosomal protein L24 n=1 Tax=Euryhalocaulis TaxID=1712422 RepID=UPI0003A027B0|nr:MULTISPECIES: 50S ribosomal protein L24 [Euryhalocaulis]MBA4801231.1 50S ribosomal protein L24 [Euryhalocaulis sp.]
MAAKIKKGDRVVILTGKDKGKTGQVVRVMPSESRVVVEGVNVAKRHQRPSQMDPGGIKEKELSIHVSNVAHADPKSGGATRVGIKTLDSGEKVRVAKKSGEVIDV